MWVCQSAAAPEILFSSTRDATGFLPGWTCRKLEQPLPQGGITSQFGWAKIAQLIESGVIP
jgi:hypothetical protein